MSLDLIFAFIFYVLLFLFFIKKRERFEVQGKIFVLYKTKIGLNLMRKLAKKYSKFLKGISYFSIFIGYLGMVFIFYFLIKKSFEYIFIPGTSPPLALVLPGVEIPGIGAPSFWYWIISIFVVAVIHEFSHGTIASLNKVEIKSSGFAFLGPILAAFVEPDEKQLQKKSKKDQLGVFSAGPFSNILTGAFIILVLIFLINPIITKGVESKGVVIVNFDSGYPIEKSGVKIGEEILWVNNKEIKNVDDFISEIEKTKPGDMVNLKTSSGLYEIKAVEHPKEKNIGYVGVSISPLKVEFKKTVLETYGKLPFLFLWLIKLLEWIALISLGVGMFNLLPLGPIDGGRILYTSLLFFTKDEKKAKKIWIYIAFICLFLIFISLLPYIWKLFLFLLKPIFFLI